MTLSPVIAGAAFGFKDNMPFFISGFYMLIAFYIIFLNRRRMASMDADESC